MVLGYVRCHGEGRYGERGRAGSLTGHESRAQVFSEKTTVLKLEGELSPSSHGVPPSPEGSVHWISAQCCELSIHRSDGYSGITARQRINTELTGQAGNNWQALG